MRNIKKWFTVVILITTLLGSAQTKTDIELNNIQLGYSKTTSIVFPYAIKSVDRGSQDILIQKAKGVENILLLKAGKQNFKQTNLTVVTADGKLYGFVLNYDEMCPILNLAANKAMSSNEDILFSSENENQKKIEQYASLALSKKKKVSGLKTNRFSVKLQVSGIFIHQEVIYFRIVIGNNSRINYDVDQLRFFIRDQKKSKRTASQEIEIVPLFSTAGISKISDHSEVSVVFAMPKFTIPEKKYFALQMIEKEGGRHVELDVKNSDLINLEILTSL